MENSGAHVERFTDRRAASAYAGFRRAHVNPGAFDLALEAVATPIGGNGFGWQTVGTALAQMAANGVTFNENLLRGYCRRIVTPPPTLPIPLLARSSKVDRTKAAIAKFMAGGDDVSSPEDSAHGE